MDSDDERFRSFAIMQTLNGRKQCELKFTNFYSHCFLPFDVLLTRVPGSPSMRWILTINVLEALHVNV